MASTQPSRYLLSERVMEEIFQLRLFACNTFKLLLNISACHLSSSYSLSLSPPGLPALSSFPLFPPRVSSPLCAGDGFDAHVTIVNSMPKCNLTLALKFMLF